jgi:hypothetical protein
VGAIRAQIFRRSDMNRTSPWDSNHARFTMSQFDLAVPLPTTHVSASLEKLRAYKLALALLHTIFETDQMFRVEMYFTILYLEASCCITISKTVCVLHSPSTMQQIVPSFLRFHFLHNMFRP